MADQERKVKITGGAMALASLAIVFAMLGSGLALVQRFNSSNDRRVEQLTLNQRLAQNTLDNCKEIEKLKKSVRQQAVTDYENLDRNLRILHIAKTAEIERTARQARDEKLRKFKVDVCPRKLAHSEVKP